MATEKLNITGWDSGWEFGNLANVDEPVSNADGSTVSTASANRFVTFDFEDVSTITNTDTVTQVSIVVRGSFGPYGAPPDPPPNFDVLLSINGAQQGFSPFAPALQSDLTSQLYQWTNWNQNWSVAQLNSLQVQVVSRDAAPEIGQRYYIDCIDVIVTFAPAQTEAPDEGTLELAGKIPVVDRTEFIFDVIEEPPRRALTLAGEAFIASRSDTIQVPEQTLSISGRQSFVNALVQQIQPSFTDSGWPTGQGSNIDDPVSNADGSVISTTLYDDRVRIFFSYNVFAGPGSNSPISEADDIFGISMLLRSGVDHFNFGDPTSTAPPGYLEVDLYMPATQGLRSLGTVVVENDGTGVLSNTLLTHPGWNQAWTLADLDAMEVRVTSRRVIEAGTTDTFSIDALDVYIEWAPQSPINRIPGEETLALTSAAPTVYYDRFIDTGAETLALAGKAPGLFRQDAEQLPPGSLDLQSYAPIKTVRFYRAPAVGTLALTGQDLTDVFKWYRAPGVGAAALAGKTPTIDVPVNRRAYPGRDELLLRGEKPLPQTTNAQSVGTVRGTRILAGKTPTTDLTLNYWVDTAVAALSLAGYAPSVNAGNRPTVTEGELALTGYAPSSNSVGLTITMAAGSLTTAGKQAFLPAPVTELALTPSAPTLLGQAEITPAATSLSLVPRTPFAIYSGVLIEIDAGSLALTGTAGPTLAFTTSLTPGQPGLISLTVDYDIEFIATPTDILLD